MAKILYLEDDSKFRNILIDVLRDRNSPYEFDGYSDPTEFLRENKSLLDYHLLMSDINMPYMKGTEFVKKHIVDKNLKIPVLFLSTGDEMDVRRAGISDFKFIPKIPDIPTLERTIRELLGEKI